MTSPSSQNSTRNRSRSTGCAATSILAAAALAAILTGCGGSGPSETACKQAMQASLATALAQGQSATPAGKPAACNGLSDATLARLAAEVINQALNPSPEPS